MYLCYVDDSGDARSGTTLTALIVEERHWTGVLSAWLVGRREIHGTFGVPKTKEIHAAELYKGRGSYCDTDESNRTFGGKQRAAVGRILLAALAKYANFEIVTMAVPETRKPLVYARFIAKLEDWAATKDSYLMVFYDGQQGLGKPGEVVSPDERQSLWDTAIRDATPYREVHRALDLGDRRIIEDVVMQDSRYSQLIQAADLIAYGAYQKHLQEHPEIWGTQNNPVPAAIIAYMKLSRHWPQTSDFGVHWEPSAETQEPPAEARGSRGARPPGRPQGSHRALRELDYQ